MTRREWIVSTAALAAVQAQEKQTYQGTRYRDYSRCLPDYLRDLAASAYQRRNQALAKLTTAPLIRERQAWARKTFWSLIGGEPERTALNVKNTGAFDRANYRVEKLVFESRPGLHVAANLYIPRNRKPPYPGVLFQMGHTPNGKAGATYQRCCQGLAQLGYLVLGFDPMGQGERIYYPDSNGIRTRLGSPDDEHSFAGKQMLLVGDSATRMHVWDAVRALDVLASHPLVDPKRLASTGQSGGGTLTMFLMTVDDRLSCAAVMSGNTENVACANFNPPGSTDDAEQDFPWSGPVGWDRWDTMYPFAPKPLLISVSHKDFFGTYSPRYVENGWEEFQKLRKIYAVLGKPEHIRWAGTPMPHGLSHDTRLLIYNWFGRWLQGENKAITVEPPVALEQDETLWVTREGNVVRAFGGQTPHSISRNTKVEKRGGDITELLRVSRPAAGLKPAVLGTAPWRGPVEVQAIEVQAAAKVWVPAWLYLPNKPDACLLTVPQAGRLTQWQEEDLYHTLALRGHAVCVMDVRGVGDLTPEFSRGAARHSRSHNEEEDYAWASLILGRPLLGQRVSDVLAVCESLRNHPRTTSLPLMVAGQGRMATPAQIATMLDKRVEALYLSSGLASIRSVVDREAYNVPFATFVPRFLEWGDLSDVTAAIRPRRILTAGMVDGAGGAAPSDLPQARWDVETLDRFIRNAG